MILIPTSQFRWKKVDHPSTPFTNVYGHQPGYVTFPQEFTMGGELNHLPVYFVLQQWWKNDKASRYPRTIARDDNTAKKMDELKKAIAAEPDGEWRNVPIAEDDDKS